jgi:flagellar assembly protein FliH
VIRTPPPTPTTTTFAFDQLEPVAAPPVPAFGAASGAPVDPGVPAAEVQRLVEQARAEGYAAGVADVSGQLEPAVAALGTAAAGVAALRDAVAAQGERAAVDLALRIAEHAVYAQLAVDPEKVVDVVRGALRRLMERERVTVLVNPEDLDVVRGHSDALVAELGGIEHCELQADRRVARGGAIVRTAEGEVDATLETKLSRAREVIEHDLAGHDGDD